jgi:hypothetical protein
MFFSTFGFHLKCHLGLSPAIVVVVGHGGFFCRAKEHPKKQPSHQKAKKDQ